MQTVQLGSQGLTVSREASAAWACPSSTARATTRSRPRRSSMRSSSASRSSTRRTCTARTRTSGWSAARSRTVATTSWSRPSSASCATPTTRTGAASTARRSTSSRPARARCSASASTTSTSTTSTASTRRRRSRRPSARWASWSRRARCASSACPRAAPETIRRAHATHPISALQTEYSIWERQPEAEILPTLRELGIGFVAYRPLGRGFLTGKLRSLDQLADDDFRRFQPRLQGDNLEANVAIVERIDALAAKKGATPAQIALAWVLAQGGDVVPIPGTKRRSYLEENAAAVDVGLSEEDIAALDGAHAAGDRYADMSSVDR